jgi:hypothetical protein
MSRFVKGRGRGAEGAKGWCEGRPCVLRLTLPIPGSLVRQASSGKEEAMK